MDNDKYQKENERVINTLNTLDKIKSSSQIEPLFKKYLDLKKLASILKDGSTRKKNIELQINRLREVLLVYYMYLVSYVAREVSIRYNKNADELVSYGYEGLIYALDNYDPDMFKQIRFTAYAMPCISGLILKNIRKEQLLPEEYYFDFIKAKREIENTWCVQFNPYVDAMLDELIDIMIAGKPKYAKKRDIIKQSIMLNYMDSLQELTEKEDNDALGESEDSIIDTFEEKMVDIVNKGLLKDRINETLKTLTPNEAKVIELRFGLNGNYKHTLQSIGNILKVTRERVRQIEANSIRKFTNPVLKTGLKPFVDERR